MLGKKVAIWSIIAGLMLLIIFSGCGSDSPGENPPADTVTISTTTLPDGTIGTSYSQTLSAGGGTPPYSWSVISGSLPGGLTLDDTNGRITGTPIIDTTYAFTIQVSDTESLSADQAFTITTLPAVSDTGCNCEPLDTIIGQTTTVSSVSELTAAINFVNGNGGNHTILIEDDSYELSSMLYITSDNVVIRSLSGNRSNVILNGGGMSGGVAHAFLIGGSNITIADISLGEV